MTEHPLRITTEYVRDFVALWGTSIGWTPTARIRLRTLGLVRLDVIEVLKRGAATLCEKETADGATILVEGFTCDDVKLRVTLWSDSNIPLIKVTNLEII